MSFLKKIDWLVVAKIVLFIMIIFSFFIKIVAYVTLGIMAWLLLGALACGVDKKVKNEPPDKNDWKMIFSGIIPWVFMPIQIYAIGILVNIFPNLLLYFSSGFHWPQKQASK